VESQVKLNLNLNRSSNEAISLSEIKRPKLQIPLNDIQHLAQNNSRIITGSTYSLDELKKEKILAGLNYLPDFSLSYKNLMGIR